MNTQTNEQRLTIQERWTMLEQTKPDVFRAYKETCEEIHPQDPVPDHTTPADQYSPENLADVSKWLDQHGIPRTRLAA